MEMLWGLKKGHPEKGKLEDIIVEGEWKDWNSINQNGEEKVYKGRNKEKEN